MTAGRIDAGLPGSDIANDPHNTLVNRGIEDRRTIDAFDLDAPHVEVWNLETRRRSDRWNAAGSDRPAGVETVQIDATRLTGVDLRDIDGELLTHRKELTREMTRQTVSGLENLLDAGPAMLEMRAVTRRELIEIEATVRETVATSRTAIDAHAGLARRHPGLRELRSIRPRPHLGAGKPQPRELYRH